MTTEHWFAVTKLWDTGHAFGCKIADELEVRCRYIRDGGVITACRELLMLIMKLCA